MDILSKILYQIKTTFILFGVLIIGFVVTTVISIRLWFKVRQLEYLEKKIIKNTTELEKKKNSIVRRIVTDILQQQLPPSSTNEDIEIDTGVTITDRTLMIVLGVIVSIALILVLITHVFPLIK